MNRYSTEEKQQAIDLYFKNGCNMKKTVREGGGGRFLGPELSNSKTASILHRTQTP